MSLSESFWVYGVTIMFWVLSLFFIAAFVAVTRKLTGKEVRMMFLNEWWYSLLILTTLALLALAVVFTYGSILFYHGKTVITEETARIIIGVSQVMFVLWILQRLIGIVFTLLRK